MSTDHLELSVVIPCRNEEKYIGLCLDSIIDSDYPKDQLKVLVCDGLSTDGTQQIVENYAAKHHFITLLKNEKQTTPFALNLGIRATNSDYVTILGAHAEVGKSYFSQSIADFKRHEGIGCTGGLLLNQYSDEVSEAIGMAQSSPFGVGNAHFRTGASSGLVDTVAFGTYSRKVFETCGYFDDELARNQDDEFNYRISQAGFKLYLNQDITAKYHVRASFKKLYSQYWQYGYWKVFVNKKHKSVTSWRQLVPAAFVLFLFLGAIIGSMSVVLFKLYAVLLGLYVALSIVSAARKSAKPKVIAQTVWAFWIIHLSYGLGYLKGVIDFILRGKSPSESSQKLTR